MLKALIQKRNQKLNIQIRQIMMPVPILMQLNNLNGKDIEPDGMLEDEQLDKSYIKELIP